MVTTVAALAALWFTNESLRATNDQFGLTRQTTITERFAKAVEQLGNSTSLDVQLGGIYLLERLAADSPTDRSSIFEVLGAYVRTHAPDGADCGSPAQMVFPVHIQAALTVIGRRSVGGPERIDLSRTCLANANLKDANLRDVDLNRANLSSADLSSARLIGANLERADLARARLKKTDLTDAVLDSAVLSDSLLNGSNLTGANLTSANLRGAFLEDATLDNADFTLADLRGSVFELPKGAQSYGPDQSIERPDGPDRGTTQPAVPATGPSMATGIRLRGANLTGALYDARTEWPAGFVPTAGGPEAAAGVLDPAGPVTQPPR